MNQKTRPKKMDMYDVSNYTEEELINNILDLNNPTDRELEHKILSLYNRYQIMETTQGKQLAKFFKDIYDRFFEDEGDEGDEGEGGGKPSKKSKPVRIGKATLDDHEYDDSKMREAEEQGAAPNKDILGDKEISEIINRIIDTNPGKGRGHNLKNIIKQHKVEIDWKTALRSFITANFTRVSTEYTYRKLKRVSYGIGVPIPSGVRTYQPDIDIVVAIDVSGSVVASPELLGKFKAEVVSLARTFKKPIEILYWDEVVQSKETIDKDGKIIKYKSSPVIKGGSGTSLSCVQEYMLKNKLRPKGVVYLTDGWIERNPVVLKGSKNLFVISTPGDISIVEPLGKVVRITSADHMYNPGRPYGGG